jgi:hypothetical protein
MVVAALLSAAGLVGLSQTAPTVHASGNGDPTAFTVTATSANTQGYIMAINSPNTNNGPNLNIQVTQVWPGNYDSHPTAVYYNTLVGEWDIFNEDGAAIPLGTSFNLSVAPNDNAGYFQFTATASNLNGDSMFIDNAQVNNHPNAVLFATQNWTGTSNPHEIGVWYDAFAQKWAVFNEDGAMLPAGATFNLVLENPPYPNPYAYTYVATAANTTGYLTFINGSNFTNQPNAIPQVTQVWDAQGTCGCVSNNHPIAVWYDTSAGEWVIYNADQATMPVGAAFFVEAI